MNKVYIGLGTNIGDRKKYLQEAITQIEANEHITVKKESSIYETAPVGYTDQSHFLNQVIMVETSLEHLELLDYCQKIEQNLGRERTIKNGPRTIDLDILMYNHENRDLGRLRIPHPRMHERAFVLIPLNEIAPELVVPTTGEKVEDLILDLSEAEMKDVVKWEEQ